MTNRFEHHSTTFHLIHLGNSMRLGILAGFMCLTLGLPSARAQSLGDGRALVAAISNHKQATLSAPQFRTRKFSSSWHDDAGKIWIFGGFGEDAGGNTGFLNDLWMWDSTQWIMLSGSMLSEQPGVYFGKSSLIPGGRMNPETWRDEDGMLWLFGGYGRDGSGKVGRLNDLWKWDGVQWTWVSGSVAVQLFKFAQS